MPLPTIVNVESRKPLFQIAFRAKISPSLAVIHSIYLRFRCSWKLAWKIKNSRGDHINIPKAAFWASCSRPRGAIAWTFSRLAALSVSTPSMKFESRFVESGLGVLIKIGTHLKSRHASLREHLTYEENLAFDWLRWLLEVKGKCEYIVGRWRKPWSSTCWFWGGCGDCWPDDEDSPELANCESSFRIIARALAL